MSPAPVFLQNKKVHLNIFDDLSLFNLKNFDKWKCITVFVYLSNTKWFFLESIYVNHLHTAASLLLNCIL